MSKMCLAKHISELQGLLLELPGRILQASGHGANRSCSPACFKPAGSPFAILTDLSQPMLAQI